MKKHLGKNEELIMQFRPSRKAYIKHYAIGVILLPVVGIGLIPIIMAELKRLSRKYGITNERVLAKQGIISENLISTKHSNITDINLNRTIFNRILDIGTLKFNTAGTHGYEVVMEGIENPTDVKKMIYDLSK